MKHLKRTSLLTGFLICTVSFSAGCSKKAIPLAEGWSPPVKITDSDNGLSGGVLLYKWHDTILGWQSLSDGSAKCLLQKRDNNSWSEGLLTGLPPKAYVYPSLDQANDTAFFE